MTLSSLARRWDVRLLAALVFAAGVAGGVYGLWTIFLKPAGPAAGSTVGIGGRHHRGQSDRQRHTFAEGRHLARLVL
jgi:hypothetical protein